MSDRKKERGFTLVDRPEGSDAADGPAPADEEIAFGSFVLSLATSAFAQLGRAPQPDEPEGETAPPDLALARQTIGLLEMLERKTRGNLERDEEQLLSGLLHELHLIYVEVREQQSAG